MFVCANAYMCVPVRVHVSIHVYDDYLVFTSSPIWTKRDKLNLSPAEEVSLLIPGALRIMRCHLTWEFVGKGSDECTPVFR